MAKTTYDNSGGRLAAEYDRLASDRQAFLDRAREAALLTIPALYPPEGTTKNTRFKKPYQSLGARAVNSLTAKILLAVLPVNQPFFRFDMDEMAVKQLNRQLQRAFPPPADKSPESLQTYAANLQRLEAEQTKVINEALAKAERTIQKRIEASTLRAKLSELVKQLIVGGASLLYCDDPKNARVYRLDSYVIQLDSTGTLVRLVIREKVHKLTLSQDLRAFLEIDYEKGHDEEVYVYTGVELQENGQYRESQEINGHEVPDSVGTYPEDSNPWIPLRFFSVDGESYGRSYVEEYIGDLESLEGLSKAIVQGAAAAAKVLFLVKNGRTSRRALARAANGDFLDGDVNDVGTLQLNKAADFSVARNTIDGIETRLGAAFLMTTSIQRQAERVTAEEIRRLAQDLEDQLGGIYTILAQNLQTPLINVIKNKMAKAKQLPALPKNFVNVSITTGLEALGRGQDAENLKGFIADLAQLGPGLSTIRMDTLASRLAVARGIDTTDLVKSNLEVAQEAQQAALQQLSLNVAEKSAPEVVKAGLAAGMGQQGASAIPTQS